MGAWGPKLYQYDVAQDIRDEFKDLLKRGKTTEEITKKMIEEYDYAINDSDDGPIFWFALADTQWNLGRLLPKVKKRALECLDSGTDQKRWQEENPKEAKVRVRVLDELREKLNSSMPPEKKIKQYNLYKCEWKIGDIFAYKLESDLAKEKGLDNKYFIIQKIDEYTWHPGHIIPIVRVKISKNDTLPINEREFDSLEYIQTSLTRYENRFLPLNGRRPIEEQIAEKSKIDYITDEFGYLPHYLLKLISTSKRIIPRKLIYIGNFTQTKSPKNEFIPHVKINISSCSWKEFEETMIGTYFGYNLREFKVYSSKNK